ncbi:MAG: hypothetical protein ACR2N9_10120 [Acidimicrobiia bacterium]
MPRTAAIAALLMLTLSLQACAFVDNDTTTGGGIEGTYYVNGVDPGGRDYGGQLIITKTASNTYDMDWIITGSIQTGTGTLSGDVIEAEWETVEGLRNSSGSARYEVQADGSLIGERLEVQFEDPAYEEAFPVELK